MYIYIYGINHRIFWGSPTYGCGCSLSGDPQEEWCRMTAMALRLTDLDREEVAGAPPRALVVGSKNGHSQ